MATIDDDRVEGWEIDGSMTSTTSVALSDDHSHQKINDPVKKQEILQRMEVAKGTKAIEVLTRVNQSMYRRGLDFHNIFNIHGSFDMSDKTLDEFEFRVVVKKVGMPITEDDFFALFNFFDASGNGSIDKSEVLFAIDQLRKNTKKPEAFNQPNTCTKATNVSSAQVQPQSSNSSKKNTPETPVPAECSQSHKSLAANMLDLKSAISRERGHIIKGVKSVASYRHQGDETMYTMSNILKRKQLREKPQISFWLDMFWKTLKAELKVVSKDGVGSAHVMLKDTYMLFFTKIAKVLLEPSHFHEKEILDQNAKEWCKSFGEVTEITERKFFNSLFETIDIWTTTATEEEYIYFASELYVRVTYGEPENRCMKSLDDITHWTEKDRDVRKISGKASTNVEVKAIMDLGRAQNLSANILETLKKEIETGESHPYCLAIVKKAMDVTQLTKKALTKVLRQHFENANLEYGRRLRKEGVPPQCWRQEEFDEWLRKKHDEYCAAYEARRHGIKIKIDKVRRRIRNQLHKSVDTFEASRDGEKHRDESIDKDFTHQSTFCQPARPLSSMKSSAAESPRQKVGQVEEINRTNIDGTHGETMRTEQNRPAVEQAAIIGNENHITDTRDEKNVGDSHENVEIKTIKSGDKSNNESVHASGSVSVGSVHLHKRGAEKPKIQKKEKKEIIPKHVIQGWYFKFSDEYKVSTEGYPEDIAETDKFEKWFRREINLIEREMVEAGKRRNKVQTRGIRISSLGSQSKEIDSDWLPFVFDDGKDSNDIPVPRELVRGDTNERNFTEYHAANVSLHLTKKWLQSTRTFPGKPLAPPISPRTAEELEHGPNARSCVPTPLDDLAITHRLDPWSRNFKSSILLNSTGVGQEKWHIRPCTVASTTFGCSVVARKFFNTSPRRPRTREENQNGEKEPVGQFAATEMINATDDATERRRRSDASLNMKTNGYDNPSDVFEEQNRDRTLTDNWTALLNEQKSNKKMESSETEMSIASFSRNQYSHTEMSASIHFSMASSVLSDSDESEIDSLFDKHNPFNVFDAHDVDTLMESIQRRQTNYESKYVTRTRTAPDLQALACSFASVAVADAAVSVKQASKSPFHKAERCRPGHRFDASGNCEALNPVAEAARSLSVRSRVLMKRGRCLLRKERSLYSPKRPEAPPPMSSSRVARASDQDTESHFGGHFQQNERRVY